MKGGVLRFVSETNYADSFGFQWNTHRKTQLDSYSGLPISKDRLFQVTGWPKRMEGQVILEAGSGAGRFTEILVATGARVFSFDYSNAVDANWANNGGNPNLMLFQANIVHLPLRRASFDKVMCLGVIQHTAEPETTFKRLAEQVRPEGELVIDVYAKTLVSQLHWKYLLRPLTRRIDSRTLYRLVSVAVSLLLPLTILLRRVAGRVGARLMPIVEYSHLGLSPKINRQWAILDTFDMYSPTHDHPQSIETVRRWFAETGFVDVRVSFGPNGVIARGRRAGRPSA
jgi:SAM-dependent methyltransferase